MATLLIFELDGPGYREFRLLQLLTGPRVIAQRVVGHRQEELILGRAPLTVHRDGLLEMTDCVREPAGTVEDRAEGAQ